MELYIHIPFCVRKCEYCDFLSFAAGKEQQGEYVKELITEIRSWKDRGDVSVSSVFIGGGTPSILEGSQIFEIIKAVREEYVLTEDAEITLEANPGTLNKEKLEWYRKAGINRLSLGLQSARNTELKMLGRIHTWEEFLESFHLAREAGFMNLNVDLMSALPGQSTAAWEDTLKKVIELEPEHISAYGLIVEEGTPFYDQYAGELKKQEAGEKCQYLPSEEEERCMYQKTVEILKQYGYERYEISNYAKAGKECRHNCGYWLRKEYKGFGLGAASLIKNQRYSNTRDMKIYLTGKWQEEIIEELSLENQMEETMFLGLRMMKGVSRKNFETCYGVPVEEIYGQVLRKMYDAGLLLEENGWIKLTEKGIDISNYVFADFLLD